MITYPKSERYKNGMDWFIEIDIRDESNVTLTIDTILQLKGIKIVKKNNRLIVEYPYQVKMLYEETKKELSDFIIKAYKDRTIDSNIEHADFPF